MVRPHSKTGRSCTVWTLKEANHTIVRMATPVRVLNVRPELDALEGKLAQIQDIHELKERQVMDREAQFERDQKTRREEFEGLKQLELQKLQERKDEFVLFQEQQRHTLQWEKEKLLKEEESFRECQRRAADITGSPDTITIEVGNDKFRTQVSTLAKYQGSLLYEIVRGLKKNQDRVFIDRDGKHFKFILNYLRQGNRVLRGPVMKNIDEYLLEEILAEVEFYSLTDLARLLRRKLVSINKTRVTFDLMLNKKYFLKCAPTTFVTSAEIIVKNENMNNIIFQSIKFQHAVTFDTCTMIKGKFINCEFSGVIRFKNVDVEEVCFENCHPVNFSKQIYFTETDSSRIIYSPPKI